MKNLTEMVKVENTEIFDLNSAQIKAVGMLKIGEKVMINLGGKNQAVEIGKIYHKNNGSEGYVEFDFLTQDETNYYTEIKQVYSECSEAFLMKKSATMGMKLNYLK